VELIDSHISAQQLSISRRQSVLFVFEFARLVSFVTPNVVGFSLANPFSNPQSQILVFGFWFLVCYATTQLATQL